jgi:hypothetical protein
MVWFVADGIRVSLAKHETKLAKKRPSVAKIGTDFGWIKIKKRKRKKCDAQTNVWCRDALVMILDYPSTVVFVLSLEQPGKNGDKWNEAAFTDEQRICTCTPALQGNAHFKQDFRNSPERNILRDVKQKEINNQTMAQSNGIPPFNDEFSIFFRFQASPPTVTLQQPASESSKNPAPKKEETKKEETKKAKPALKEEDKKSKPDEGKKESKPTSKAEKPPPSEENLKLHAQLLKVGEECLESSELLQLVQFRNGQIRFYDGFEPSGRMHIAQGVFKSLNVNTCTQAGVFVFWVADFFALMNDKMGGDLSKIKIVGEYLVEVWKAAGMDLSKVEILWASDEIVKNSEAYMAQVRVIFRFSQTNLRLGLRHCPSIYLGSFSQVLPDYGSQ